MDFKERVNAIEQHLADYRALREQTKRKFKEIIKGMEIVGHVNKLQSQLIGLMLPLYDSQACYDGDNYGDGYQQFGSVSDEEAIHDMLSMMTAPGFEWISGDCDVSTNGDRAAFKLVKEDDMEKEDDD